MGICRASPSAIIMIWRAVTLKARLLVTSRSSSDSMVLRPSMLGKGVAGAPRPAARLRLALYQSLGKLHTEAGKDCLSTAGVLPCLLHGPCRFRRQSFLLCHPCAKSAIHVTMSRRTLQLLCRFSRQVAHIKSGGSGDPWPIALAAAHCSGNDYRCGRQCIMRCQAALYPQGHKGFFT